MKKMVILTMLIVTAVLFSTAMAQTPAEGVEPQESQAQQTQAEQTQAEQKRITEKEVIAVQAALIRRGYLKTKPAGVLDRETREAVRRYQADNGLKDTGRIDLATYHHLGLIYPATGREAETLQSPGMLSRVGGSVRDTGVFAAQKAGAGARVGLEKTWDAGSAVASKSKSAAAGAGRATVKGTKGMGRASSRAGNSLIRRSDADVEAEVADELNANPATRGWRFSVQSGMVTIKVPREHQADLGDVVSNLRKIPGVKSVVVIAL